VKEPQDSMNSIESFCFLITFGAFQKERSMV
jgi:hypothetical protein